MSRNKKVLLVALALFGLLSFKMAGQYFANATAQLEQVETYKWYPAQAEEIYQEITADYPGSDYALEAHRNLVISYLSAKRDAEAQETFDKLVADFSGHSSLPVVLYDIARIYERSRKYEKAKNIYQQIIQQYPDSSSASKAQLAAPRIEALSHIEAEDDDAADAATDSLTANFSSRSELPLSLYDIARRHERCERTEKYEKAKSIYQQIIQQYPDTTAADRAQLGVERTNIFSLIKLRDETTTEAVDSLIANFSGHPDLPEALYDIARKYEKTKEKEYEEAKNIYQQVIQQHPNSSHAARAQLIVPKMNIFSLIESGQIESAQAAIDSLMADFTGHSYLPAVLSEIAKRYERAEKYEQAENAYQQIIQRYPESRYAESAELQIPKNQIVALIDAGDEASAQVEIDNLIADFNDRPDLPRALSLIAAHYYKKASLQLMENQGPDEQGRDHLQKAVAIYDMLINEFPASTATAQTYRLAGDCYRKLGECEKSLVYYQKVIDDYSGYHLVYHAQFFTGRCLEALRDSGALPEPEANEQIEQAYQAIVENYPDCKWFGYACEELGWLSFRKRQWDQAAQYFELYLSKYPDSEQTVHILYFLGRAYEEMGQLDLAIQVYNKFIATADPNDSRIEQVKAWLEALGGAER